MPSKHRKNLEKKRVEKRTHRQAFQDVLVPMDDELEDDEAIYANEFKR